MMRHILTFLIYMLSVVTMSAGEPFCDIRNYDERDGLSQRLVKQVVQDDNGVLWVATWNGLNRFDGYEFKCIRPGINDGVRRYSSRIGDIKLGPDGRLWCRIDHKIVRFDVNDYTFFDSHSLLEEKFGRRLRVRGITMTTADELVLTLVDSTYIIMPPTPEPEREAVMTGSTGGRKYKSPSNRRLGSVGPYAASDLVMSRRDEAGTVWLVTRDGDVICAPDVKGPFKMMGHIEGVANMGLRYATSDSQGNVWLCSKTGLHRLTFGTAPYSMVSHDPVSMLRTSCRDSRGRVWLSWSDARCLTLSGPDTDTTMYVGPDGSLSARRVSFGAAVYSIVETRPGEIWLGTKPDGLFRLTEREGGGYDVKHFVHDSSRPDSPSGNAYYDGAVDSRGRLWLASMGTGMDVVPYPSAPEPVFHNVASSSGYPSEAMSVRRISLLNDSMGVAATTAGLLGFSLPASDRLDDMRFALHVSEPGREMSLGNIATMDVGLGPDGSLYVATESDGVARLMSPLSDGPVAKWDFRSYRVQGGVNPDVALSVQPAGNDSMLLVTGGNDVSLLDPRTGETRVYGASFWHRDMRFSDAKPLRLDNGEWLFGLNDGAVRVRLDSTVMSADTLPLAFNTVSIAGRPDSLLTPRCDRITLAPSERDVTLRFSALCYADPATLRYAFRVGDDPWTPLGASRTVSFADLDPGTYTVTVRSTDTHGRWLDNDRSVTVEVLPTFWETGTAKALYVILTLAFVGAVIWTTVYIRHIKRQQREMLESHLRQLEARAVGHESGIEVTQGPQPAPVQTPPPPSPRLSDEDRQLMDAVMDYIETHLSDSDITVDDMALAVAVSRSGLTRKMKSLMGVTPAEFLRETRLTRASTLLATTSRPIKEIAVVCGFSDMNYFGKCFKSSRGLTPGAYRKANSRS